MSAPKLFFSYSWSSPQHEEYVLALATALREHGIDVIMDKWHLREGDDAYAFMERMVTDENIKKVAMICDKSYAEKADGRRKGVGTETQLISRKVYESQNQDKFVAVVTEKDQEGNAFVPAYYKSRIHIDLSDPTRYSEHFEQLVRWVFDKPRHIPPKIGKPPSFITEENLPQLGTASRASYAMQAARDQRGNYLGALNDYLDTLSASLEELRLSGGSQEGFIDLVLKSIDDFLHYRNEYVQVISTLARYANNEEVGNALHRFFEKLIPYLHPPKHIHQYTDWDFDNLRFIVHELFLYTVAIFLKEECFDMAHMLLEKEYYVGRNADYGADVMVGYGEFRQPTRSISALGERERKVSKQADLLQQRSSSSGIDFGYLIQADFLCWIRQELKIDNGFHQWYPVSLLYIREINPAQFEIFSRASSKRYFDKIKSLLGIESPKDLEPLLLAYQRGDRRVPQYQWVSINPAALMGYDKLASKP